MGKLKQEEVNKLGSSQRFRGRIRNQISGLLAQCSFHCPLLVKGGRAQAKVWTVKFAPLLIHSTPFPGHPMAGNTYHRPDLCLGWGENLLDVPPTQWQTAQDSDRLCFPACPFAACALLSPSHFAVSLSLCLSPGVLSSSSCSQWASVAFLSPVLYFSSFLCLFIYFLFVYLFFNSETFWVSFCLYVSLPVFFLAPFSSLHPLPPPIHLGLLANCLLSLGLYSLCLSLMLSIFFSLCLCD